MPKQIPWTDVQEMYECSTNNVKAISEHFDIHPTGIRRKAKQQEWKKFEHDSLTDLELVTVNPIIKAVAMRKITEIREELGDHYRSIDEPLIVIFSENYQSWIEMKSEMNRTGLLIPGARGNVVMNPLFKAIKDTESKLLNYAQQLGISFASRKRLGRGETSTQTGSLFDLEAEIDDLIGKSNPYE